MSCGPSSAEKRVEAELDEEFQYHLEQEINSGLKAGLAPEEVRRKMGEPTHISYSASKGQLVEQWIYLDNPKLVRYVNFLHSPGELKPRLIAYYTMPRASVKGGLGTAR